MPSQPAPSTAAEQDLGRLQRLHDAGVSIWLDTLSRDLLERGEFDRLIAGSAVTGATSNPTNFARAITGSDRYDEQLRAAVARGIKHPRELFFELALQDVADAADRLRDVYDASGGRDGLVSFECTPELADDTEGTIEQATALWSRLARPSMMIKVPATAAGIPAIEELTARGVNVNITLLFSVDRYEQVIDAYVAGLERRRGAGHRVGRDRVRRLVLRLTRRRQGRCVAAPSTRRCAVTSRGQRPASLRPLPPPLRRRTLARPARRRRQAAATAVGQHGDEGPCVFRRPLHRAADRARRRQHDDGSAETSYAV